MKDCKVEGVFQNFREVGPSSLPDYMGALVWIWLRLKSGTSDEICLGFFGFGLLTCKMYKIEQNAPPN